MNVLMVRAKIKEENVADARAAIEKVIHALEEAQPAGVRYASCLLSDGVTFVALAKAAPHGRKPANERNDDSVQVQRGTRRRRSGGH